MTTLMDYSESGTAEKVGEDGKRGYCVVCRGEYGRIVLADTPAEAVAHRTEAHPWLAPVLRALGVDVTA